MSKITENCCIIYGLDFCWERHTLFFLDLVEKGYHRAFYKGVGHTSVNIIPT